MSTEHLVSNNERRKSCTTGGLEVLKGAIDLAPRKGSLASKSGGLGPAGTRLKDSRLAYQATYVTSVMSSDMHPLRTKVAVSIRSSKKDKMHQSSRHYQLCHLLVL